MTAKTLNYIHVQVEEQPKSRLLTPFGTEYSHESYINW